MTSPLSLNVRYQHQRGSVHAKRCVPARIWLMRASRRGARRHTLRMTAVPKGADTVLCGSRTGHVCRSGRCHPSCHSCAYPSRLQLPSVPATPRCARLTALDAPCLGEPEKISVEWISDVPDNRPVWHVVEQAAVVCASCPSPACGSCGQAWATLHTGRGVRLVRGRARWPKPAACAQHCADAGRCACAARAPPVCCERIRLGRSCCAPMDRGAGGVRR